MSRVQPVDEGIPLSLLLQFAFALVFAVLPGLACVLWIFPRSAGLPARIGAALALSTPLGGGLIALLVGAGLSLRVAATLLFVASGLLALTGSARLRGSRVSDADRKLRAVWWIVGAFVAGTALFPSLREWWRIYSDAWTHAGIVREIGVSGLPPMDPGFAGVPLQYAWIYHTFVAGAHALTGMDVFVFMAVLSACALSAVLLCAAGICSRVDPSSVGWTLVFLVLGLNALFPLFLPIQLGRAFTGEVRGAAELARIFDFWPLDSDRAGVFLRSLGGEDFFLDKFMVATPFALSLGATAAWLDSLRRWFTGGAASELGLAALLTLAAGLMHPVVGLHLGATTALLLLFLVVFRRGAGPVIGRAVRWSFAVLAGLVPVLFYTGTIVGGRGGTHHEFPMDLAPLKILGYASCLGLGLVFAFTPLRRMLRGSDPDRAWGFALLAGGCIALVVRLPGPSPYFTVDKFVYLVWIPLAITAGPAFATFLRARSRSGAVAITLLLFLPVNGLALASRVVDHHNRVRQPWNREVYVWLRTQTPVDAVLVTPAGDWETAQFAERDQYYSLGHPSVQLGYDLGEIHARSALVGRLFGTGSLTAEDRLRLAALHRPLYIVWTDLREPLWADTPGALAREGVSIGPKPEFDAAFPVLFRADGQEVRELPQRIGDGPVPSPGDTILGRDSMSAHP